MLNNQSPKPLSHSFELRLLCYSIKKMNKLNKIFDE